MATRSPYGTNSRFLRASTRSHHWHFIFAHTEKSTDLIPSMYRAVSTPGGSRQSAHARTQSAQRTGDQFQISRSSNPKSNASGHATSYKLHTALDHSHRKYLLLLRTIHAHTYILYIHHIIIHHPHVRGCLPVQTHHKRAPRPLNS